MHDTFKKINVFLVKSAGWFIIKRRLDIIELIFEIKINLLIFSSRLDQNMSFYSLTERIVFHSKYLFFAIMTQNSSALDADFPV